MGHELKYSSYPENVNKKSVQDHWDNYARHEGWQAGCSGLEGPIRWIDHICANKEEAEQYIEDHDDGWYSQLAVKYREYPRVEPTKTLLNLEERLKAERNKLQTYSDAHAVSTFKAEFVGCPECGSKLKRELLKGNSCPLCNAELRGKTTIDTIERYKTNIRELRKEIKEENRKLEEKMVKKSVIKWFVKIEIHT